MFGLNGGEWFLVAFVTVMVVSARYWPALAERIAVRISGGAPEPKPSPSPAAAPPPRE